MWTNTNGSSPSLDKDKNGYFVFSLFRASTIYPFFLFYYSSFSKPYKISCYRFSSSFNQSLFSPYTPDVRHFTMEPICRSISFSLCFPYQFLTGSTYLKGRKIIYWVTWWHPAFLFSRILPPRASQNTAKQKNYWVVHKCVHLIAMLPLKALLSVRCRWLAVFLPLWCAMTARVPFSFRTRKIVSWTKYIGSLARRETVPLFRKSRKTAGSKSVLVKEVMLENA